MHRVCVCACVCVCVCVQDLKLLNVTPLGSEGLKITTQPIGYIAYMLRRLTYML